MTKGIFITLEGGEGTGKSTQAKLLQQALLAAGIPALTTREPGGTDQAERIRQILTHRDSGVFDPMTEALLLFAARREHLVHKIWPALEKGEWVISDRFADSSRAFQGYGMGLDMQIIENLYKMVAGDFQPDLTFIFDIDPALGLNRSLQRLQQAAAKADRKEDRYERMGLPFHQRLRDGFLEIARKFPDRCVIIDAAQDVQAIHRQVLKVVEGRYGIQAKEVQNG